MMARRTVSFVFLLLLSISAARSVAEPRYVEVFTSADQATSHTEDLQAKGIKVSVYQIDDIKRINADLVKGLPNDEKQATAILRQRFESRKAAIEQHYTQCADGVLKAYGYQLDRYPAVVFDGQAIVYGVSDLELAYRQYQAWQLNNRR